MTEKDKATQLRVGIFMAIGLAAVASMVVYFGRFGDAVRGYYDIRAEFPDASGIYKGAAVLLAGAKIGVVENNPVILKDMNGVWINLKIYDDVEIPSKADFLIGSSGLLGDKYVQIALEPGAKDSPPIQPDATVKGRTESGIGDLAGSAEAMLADVQKSVDDINAITARINDPAMMDDVKKTLSNVNQMTAKLDGDLLKKSTVEDMSTIVANLRKTTESFAESAKKIDEVIAKVDGAVAKADGAIVTGDEAMKSAKIAADELKKAITEVRAVVQQTKQGRGAIGALLVDREMAENLKALVSNMRRNGILFYKDQAEKETSAR